MPRMLGFGSRVTVLFFLTSYVFAVGAPPFSGTIFIDPDIITSSDPSTFTGITAIGTGNRMMFDRRVNSFQTYNVWLFNATYTDTPPLEVQVNPEFTESEAQAAAAKYGAVIGRLPRVLRTNVKYVWIHRGAELFGGGNLSLLIHTDQAATYETNGILEEALVHEAAHTSLDSPHASSPGWVSAQSTDPEYISTYAHDFPEHEDVAESFLTWMALRFRSQRISTSTAQSIAAAIPNRLKYFDLQGFEMYPVSANSVPGPTVTSINPASGSGASASFAVTYTHLGGSDRLASTMLLLNSSNNVTGACLVEYNAVTRTFRLMNDAGNAWLTPGFNGKISNGQCTFDAIASAAVLTPNNLTVVYPLSFTSSFSGSRRIYGHATDISDVASGWKELGTWDITTGGPIPAPDVISLSPTTGAGTSATFAAIFRHAGGISKHYLGYMLFLPLPNVVSFQAQGSCLVEYNRISNGMRLINDAGNNWIGPPEGVPVAPGTAPLSNNACTVDVANATATLSAGDMVVRIPVTFKPAGVTLVLGTFLQEQDVDGKWTDFRQFGNWVVPGAPTKPGPAVVASYPPSGSGPSATVTATVSHTSGAASIDQVHFRLNTAIVGGSPCHVVYFAQANTIALVNDAANALVGPVALGSPINSDRCRIAAGASRSISGNNLTLALPFTFTPSTFGGAKNLYLNVFDVFGGVTHWVQTGTWTVQ
jgi:hypothetical protein